MTGMDVDLDNEGLFALCQMKKFHGHLVLMNSIKYRDANSVRKLALNEDEFTIVLNGVSQRIVYKLGFSTSPNCIMHAQ